MAPTAKEQFVIQFIIIVDLRIERYYCVLALTDKAGGEVLFRPLSVTRPTNDNISDPGQEMADSF